MAKKPPITNVSRISPCASSSGGNAARRLYARFGFVLEESWNYAGFADGLVSESWRLKL